MKNLKEVLRFRAIAKCSHRIKEFGDIRLTTPAFRITSYGHRITSLLVDQLLIALHGEK